MSDDVVNHPQHYTAHPSGIECLTVTRHMNFNLGNATKYIWRAGLKGDAVEDLRKAAFYIADEIARLEAHREELRAELVRGIEEQFVASDDLPPLPGAIVQDGDAVSDILAAGKLIHDAGVSSGGWLTVHNPDGTSHPANVPPVERWHE